MITQTELDNLIAMVQELKHVIEQQQQQIKSISDSNRRLTQRVNRLDRHERESHQTLW